MGMDMAPIQQQDHTAQVAEKVMRRIEIAKVARNLQDCLAFASFKAQNGWQDRTLSSIESEVQEKLARRKRPLPDDLHISDSSSSIMSDDTLHTARPSNSADSYLESRKRTRIQDTQSTPVLEHASSSDFPGLQDSPMFDAPMPEDEEHDNLVPPSSSIRSSSPPRTPPPNRPQLAGTKQASADLLLYLANSPRTPAVHVHHISSATKGMPSTPPHQYAALPSSAMTPGNLGLFNGALQTPGNFNLAEFCNVTPSPAQAHFKHDRTPLPSATPYRTTRRSLNFDALLPPSPSDTRKASKGLALSLGDDLNRH